MRAANGAGFERKCAGHACRSCEHTGLVPVLDYGPMPLSDGFLASPGRGNETRAPLELAFCPDCTLLQILETLEPADLFGADYVYLSSCSDSWLAHCKRNARALIERFGLSKRSRVLEIASNDGYLLQYFREDGIPVQGVDPAPAAAAQAAERGISTVNAFFTHALGKELASERRADLLISNNVLAHVADTHDFIRGVNEVLAPGGSWVIEVPYAKDLVEGCAFDTVYHEHLCYFSVTSLGALLDRHGLVLNDVQRLPTHGGSLRLFASRNGPVSEQVGELREEEGKAGMGQPACYLDFAARARQVASEVAGMLERSSTGGRRIAAYGAAAKGTILLNCLGEAARHVAFVADRNPLKHGKWVPGVDIPIVPLEEITDRQPDDLLLLPWNLRAEILQQERDFLRSGGRFIVPLPNPEIVSAEAV